MLIANKSCDFYYRSCNTKYPLVSNHTSAQLDGMVWPSQSQTEPGGRNGAGPSANQQQSRQVLLCKFDIHNFIFHYIYIYTSMVTSCPGHGLVSYTKSSQSATKENLALPPKGLSSGRQRLMALFLCQGPRLISASNSFFHVIMIKHFGFLLAGSGVEDQS